MLGATAGAVVLWGAASALLWSRGAPADELPLAPAFAEVASAGRGVPTPALRAGGRAAYEFKDATTPPSAWSAAPLVGVLLLAGAGAAGARARALASRAPRGRVALRVGTTWWHPIKEKMRLIPEGKKFEVVKSSDAFGVTMTKEDEAQFLKEKCDNLREIMPMSDEEYADTVVYNHYFWRFPQIGHRQKWNMRQELAKSKMMQAKIHKPFLDDFRLIKPLILKYPNLAKRWNDKLPDKYGNRPESIRQELDGNWIHGEETAAGFTYEDYANETVGATFKSWSQPKMGEIVSGVIAAYHKDGCFVEVGAKTWAFMPLKFLSLVPVVSAQEAGLTIGKEVEVKVLSTIADSMLLRDWDCKFSIVSITEILRLSAMDEVEAKQRGDEGTQPLFDVVVESFRPFGAIVRTISGLPGLISTAELGDLAGNMQMLGQTITVEVQSRFTDRDLLSKTSEPQGPSDFGLRFSYKNAATRELSQSVKEGEVLDGVVSAVLVASIELKVPVGLGTARVEVRKIDICALPDWDTADYFEVDQEIKAFVISTEATTGNVRLSFRALDKPVGTILINKEKYNADAEENAKVYYEKAVQEKEKLFERTRTLLEDDPNEGTPAKTAKKGTIDDDMDDIF